MSDFFLFHSVLYLLFFHQDKTVRRAMLINQTVGMVAAYLLRTEILATQDHQIILQDRPPAEQTLPIATRCLQTVLRGQPLEAVTLLLAAGDLFWVLIVTIDLAGVELEAMWGVRRGPGTLGMRITVEVQIGFHLTIIWVGGTLQNPRTVRHGMQLRGPHRYTTI